MERDIMKQLVEWKDAADRKPLLLTGVRQCGKTYVCKEFGAQHFEDVAYFYFEGNKGLISVFEYDFDVNRIIDELGNVIRGKEIVPGKTLVIFDEIQACPNAITSLKYFCENMRELHIVCAGSLLGVSVKRDNISFPVGKVDRLQMYPLSFSEFLRADGGEKLYLGVQKYGIDRELTELYTNGLEKALKYYYIVGGMPEVVAKWVETHNFEKVEKLQDNILQDYSSDFAKHAPKADVPKLGWIWESIPKQLAKDNNKFVFSHVKEGKRSSELEDALEWLVDAGLVHRLELVSNPEFPLSFCADATFFKVYLSDVGLLRRKSGVSHRTILEDSDLYRNFKGAFTENFVLNELVKQGIRPYFWRSGNTAELDFLFEYEDSIVPVEAKAEIRTRAKSYMQYCKKYQPKIGFKFSMKNVGNHETDNTKTYSVPLYLIWMVKEYLKDQRRTRKMNIAVFASHGGSDLQAIIDGCKNQQINARVAVVISNNSDSMALQRANNENIPAYHLSAKKSGSEEVLAEEILALLTKYDVDMIFLAGYMRMLHVSVLEKYNNRIFNIHPALLPKFGGKGMYGMNVHTAVIEAKEKETGVTIHRVSAEYDSGEIVAQTKVPVLENDTPDILAARVLEREHEFLVDVISDIVNGKIMLG